jgi:hypothetical protein
MQGGTIPALVDCAASSADPSVRQQQQHEHSQQHLAILTSVSECACWLLHNADHQSKEQAELLVACISKVLSESTSNSIHQVLSVLQLLLNALRQMTDQDGCLWLPLLQVLETVQGQATVTL